MKVSLIAAAFLFQLTGTAQQQEWATESLYDFSQKGALDLKLKGLIDSVFIINAQLKSVRDKHFCVLFLEQVSISNKSFANNGGNEEKPDSLFFDMDKKIVYNLKEQSFYTYAEKKYEVPSVSGDSSKIKSGDVSLVLSKSLDKLASPSPTIAGMDYGIAFYSGKNFSFKYLSSQEVQISLKKIHDRVVGFKQGTGPFPFKY